MKDLQIHIVISSELYTKNPESSELGKKIVCTSIEMINALGFEAFTFKKLGVKIKSNESSIYRYFSNKHTLLMYLINWYWSWVDYRLLFAITNVSCSTTKLTSAIDLLTQKVTEDTAFSFVNEVLLHKIIITEASKSYHTKDVTNENDKGYYTVYKRVVQRVSDLILELNPNYKFPHMLISTVIEGAHHQRYFSEYLPALTDIEEGKNNISIFYKDLVFRAIQQ